MGSHFLHMICIASSIGGGDTCTSSHGREGAELLVTVEW